MRLILGDESFGNVHSVEFDGGVKVTDAHLTPLADLSNLKILNLRKTHVADEGLVHLYGLRKLRYLGLPPPYNTHVTQEGIDKLKTALPNCEIHR